MLATLRTYSFWLEHVTTQDMDEAIVRLGWWLRSQFGERPFRMRAKTAGPCVLEVTIVGPDIGPLEWDDPVGQTPAEEG